MAAAGRSGLGYRSAMITLVKKAFWIAVGMVAALEADRWLSRQRVRMSPRAMTGSMLDKLNQTLERRNSSP
jgi:hypothetical protein